MPVSNATIKAILDRIEAGQNNLIKRVDDFILEQKLKNQIYDDHIEKHKKLTGKLIAGAISLFITVIGSCILILPNIWSNVEKMNNFEKRIKPLEEKQSLDLHEKIKNN